MEINIENLEERIDSLRREVEKRMIVCDTLYDALNDISSQTSKEDPVSVANKAMRTYKTILHGNDYNVELFKKYNDCSHEHRYLGVCVFCGRDMVGE